MALEIPPVSYELVTTQGVPTGIPRTAERVVKWLGGVPSSF